jgi:phthalate 4,5-cis-dihydrodiol dehydrogenase
MMDRSARKIRFGILGLGMAGGMMAPYLASHPRVVISGAADLNPELRARFLRDHDVEVNSDARALLSRQDIDAVYIATPHQFHKEHAVLAAEHGKHIVVEKPMALSLSHCDTIIEAAERHRVVLVVGHTHSFDPAIRCMRELAAGGELGPLAMIAMWNYTDFLYRPRRPEELDTSRGGGIIFNQIPHQVDIARLLAGSRLRRVRAMTAVLDPRRPTEGGCMAFLDFANGAAATLVYSGYDRFDSDELHSWIGSTGRRKLPRHGATRRELVAMKDQDAEVRLRSERYGYGGNAGFMTDQPEHQPHFGTLVASYEHADVRPSPTGVAVYSDEGAREITLPPGSNGRAYLIDEFYDAVVNGVPPVHSGEFARGTVEASLAILESARQRREIVLRQ